MQYSQYMGSLQYPITMALPNQWMDLVTNISPRISPCCSGQGRPYQRLIEYRSSIPCLMTPLYFLHNMVSSREIRTTGSVSVRCCWKPWTAPYPSLHWLIPTKESCACRIPTWFGGHPKIGVKLNFSTDPQALRCSKYAIKQDVRTKCCPAYPQHAGRWWKELQQKTTKSISWQSTQIEKVWGVHGYLEQLKPPQGVLFRERRDTLC